MIRFRFRPRLRTLLLVANIMTLLLPISMIVLLQLYESELVRQTESALIGQGALLAATFRQEILRNSSTGDLFLTDKPLASHSLFNKGQSLTPIRPQLDVARETIFSSAPDGVQAAQPPDPATLAAGQLLEPILHDAKRITLAGIRLVDHRGTVVASSGSEYGLSLINRQEVKKALQGNYVSLLRQRISDEPAPSITSHSRRAWLRVFVALPVLEKGRVLGAVVLSRSPIGVGRGLYMIRNHLIKASVVLVILVLLVSLFTTLAISQPIKALVRQADMVRRGESDATQTIRHPGTVEVAGLSHSIAQMAASLAARADYIRTFANNVSHELKTPITSLKGSVELLQDHGNTMSMEEQQRFLDNMAGDIDGLERRVRRLLELARADVVQPGTASCDVNKVLLLLHKRYENREVEISGGKGLPEVKMDQEILESILVNIIENALQHGGPKTRVKVIAQTNETDRFEWLISDTGQGISKDNATKIFRPFFTTARHQGGTGLGLSIIKSLLTAHNGTIELLPTEHGATFRVII